MSIQMYPEGVILPETVPARDALSREIDDGVDRINFLATCLGENNEVKLILYYLLYRLSPQELSRCVVLLSRTSYGRKRLAKVYAWGIRESTPELDNETALDAAMLACTVSCLLRVIKR